MGEKNGRHANLIKQRRYDLVPGYMRTKEICTVWFKKNEQPKSNLSVKRELC